MGPWIPAYNTNGFAHHRLDQAILLLSELGYGGVALTLDVHHLDPFSRTHADERNELARMLASKQMLCIVETGARFNLDFRRKHYPSLLCRGDRGIRVDFLRRAIETAHELGAATVSMWSGHDFEDVGEDQGFELLVEGIAAILPDAEAAGVDLAFEPEPGMFVETLAGYERLKRHFPSPRFGLHLDVGHLMVTGECEIPDAIRRYRGEILTIAIEDMKRGVHEHLPFGDGDIDFGPVFVALHEIGYRGFLTVELSRHSADAAAVASRALDFLTSS